MSSSRDPGPSRGGPPVRVLLSHTDSFWGGDKAQMVELAAGLDPRRYEPLVVTTAPGRLTEECAARGITALVVPFGYFRRNRGAIDYLVRGPRALRRLVRERRIGLVHAHCDYSTIAMERTARRAGIPFVQHVHDMDRAWVSRKKLPVLGRADAVVAISETVARWLEERQVPKERIRVVYNGLHLGPFLNGSTRERMRATLGLAADDVAVGVFARLELSRKGQDDIVRAIARSEAPRSIHLFLVGRDDHPSRADERKIRALIAELGVGERVHLLGERTDVPELMSAMDLLGAPFHREGFGRVVIEGMAARLPVVGYRSGALPELVRDEVEGILVEEGSAQELSGAITRLANDAAVRASLGERARSRALGFSHERFLAEMQAIYDELLAVRGA
jgi:glycosyltransferase involved in cell wall biosynthesis